MSSDGKYKQTALEVGLDIEKEVKTCVIKRRRDFDNLFFGFRYCAMKT